ncbi:hypothetical protein [Arthrobacter sp. NicSoilB11]|uniref:hypothetical protein n=1 Tax=Arthrobacter sp. NicSoilB11 TaxID=2830999 RepID=UPI001CC642D7|nr:hypothetical protein [Arthrobacter sp. NicSoilB11]
MDILELSNSKVRQTLKDEYLLDALLHTWNSLADVYGRAATPANREVARLQLMVEAGHALIMAEGTGYPGEETLLRRYWLETEMLDLSRIHKGTADFKDVGSDLEYIKRQRKELPQRPTPVQLPQQQQPTSRLQRTGRRQTVRQTRALAPSRLPRTRIDSRPCRPAAAIGVSPLQI